MDCVSKPGQPLKGVGVGLNCERDALVSHLLPVRMLSGLRLCFPASFGSESRLGEAQHGRKGGTQRCVIRSFTILVTDASFITSSDVMTSGPRPVRILILRSPSGFLLPTHTASVEAHSRHWLPTLIAFASSSFKWYPISRSQFCMSELKVSNEILSG